MKKSTILILKYFFSWIILCVIYFFLSEEITKLIAPGFHDIGIWIIIVSSGIVLITIVTIILFIFNLLKLKKNQR